MKKKTKALVATVATLAVVGTCGVALTACGGSDDNTAAKTYSMRIASWDEWSADNEHPFSMGQGGAMWGWDTWLSASKTHTDDEGNFDEAYWEITLTINENGGLPGYVGYTLDYAVHAGPSAAYKESSDMVYSFHGYAYEKEGSYQLLVPHFAEVTVVSEAVQESFVQGFEAQMELVGPNGGTLYYWYANSDLQAANAKYDFPVQQGDLNILQGLYACDVLVSGSKITGFDNITDLRAPVPEIAAGEAALPDLPGFADLDEISQQVIREAHDGNLTGTYTLDYVVADLMGNHDNDINWTSTITLSDDGTLTIASVAEKAPQFGASEENYAGNYKVANVSGTMYLYITGIVSTDDRGNGLPPENMSSTQNWAGTTGNVIVALNDNDNTFESHAIIGDVEDDGDDEGGSGTGGDIGGGMPAAGEDDSEVNYSFAPGWANGEGSGNVEETVTATLTPSAKNNMMGSYSSVDVTITLNTDGTAAVAIKAGPNNNSYTATYKTYELMGSPAYVIQLTDTSLTLDEDKTEEGGLTIGNNTFNWISQSGRIVLKTENSALVLNTAPAGGMSGPIGGNVE